MGKKRGRYVLPARKILKRNMNTSTAKTNILAGLNEKQAEAVQKTDGPLLVLAGAGSGKTKTLTHKIAYLIKEKGVRPGNILAVTFTNKAAGEMRERIFKLLGTSGGSRAVLSPHSRVPIIGTFHSVCVRILRADVDKIGHDTSFNIFDTNDQKSVIKEGIKDLGLDTNQYKPGAFLGAISAAKNELLSASDFATQTEGYYEEIVAKVYEYYENRLRQNSAYDFDDLLLVTNRLFREVESIRKKYQDLFRYILVDEYQDTNHAQYSLIRMLSQPRNNVCVVGDDWQSIYKFRGADIKNILNFERDYPECTVVHLEQNYRSTQVILDAAHGVISNNTERKDKKLWTDAGNGNPITYYEAQDEMAEAEYISNETRKQVEGGRKFADFAILYRTNAQSRAIEEVFLHTDIPYKIVGGVKFYDRKEIKDILAYVRLIHNPFDVLSLERIANEPKRGIGASTIDAWKRLSREANCDLIEMGLEIDFSSGLRKDKIRAVREFSAMLQKLREKLLHPENITLHEFIEKICETTGYKSALFSERTAENQSRWENIQELVTVSARHDDLELAEATTQFLEDTALSSESDDMNESEGVVHCMTLHASKGLEFPAVFLVGLEEGILPHSRSYLVPADLEEERRLMYVGITRAMEKVYLTCANHRAIFGSVQANPPSRFVSEIPEDLIEHVDQNKRTSAFDDFTQKRREKYQEKKESWNTSSSDTNKSEARQKIDVADGSRVTHPQFGEGLVIAQTKDDITIAFADAGLKKLSKEFAKLEVVK